MANRYKLLPSEVLNRADTLDVLVADAAISWHNYVAEQEHARAEGKAAPANVPVATLEKMIQSVRSKNEHKIS